MTVTQGKDAVKNFLAVNDVRYIFGNPGTTETTFLAILPEVETNFILALHESSATGIAAGYALVTKQPALLHIHTYPGLANTMFNLRNAFEAGIPLLVIAGQQDTHLLIHNPVLSGPNTQLASSACKYTLEIYQADDLALGLQRCYLQAKLEPQAPVFLSIPTNLINEETKKTKIRTTKIINDTVAVSIKEVVKALQAVPKGKLLIISDYAVGSDDAIDELTEVAKKLNADIYSGPFHVHPVADPNSAYYKGELSPLTDAISSHLENYETLLLLGCKIETFLYTGIQAVPDRLKIIQISPVQNQLGFDYPVDIAVCGNLKSTLAAISLALGDEPATTHQNKSETLADVELKYSAPDRDPSDKVIIEILKQIDRKTHIVTEGSSEDAIIQDLAPKLGFQNVHFSPRGGGLGWAMPFTAGIALAEQKHAVCFVGDGGSMYSIHTLWTAAKYKIPTIFVCFINHEYRILKDLLCLLEKTQFEETTFIGLDFKDPEINLESIARGFGAHTQFCHSVNKVSEALASALSYRGPTVLFIKRCA